LTVPLDKNSVFIDVNMYTTTLQLKLTDEGKM
jgi:hypothetical protein